MFGVFVAFVAISAFMTPPEMRREPGAPDIAARHATPPDRPAAASATILLPPLPTDGNGAYSPAAIFDPIWIPLPCARHGDRMIC
ncbi:MAG: hypothetical protein DI605_09620 [Sphingomonas sp.]|nr:MAG: hypothetical protein DI605_09620 [Sphingomonas sp.]